MQKFPEEKLEKLITEKKWDQVTVELKNWLTSETEPEVEAEKLLLAAKVYARVRNALGDAYLKELKELTEILKRIGQKSRAVDDIEKTQKIQNKIKDL
ncbi:MAG: hypothetical protein WC725_05570 [Patescibacteria group bacterium]|jgi:hypothetical protein